MQKLFGTDGIRGRVNQAPITPEMALHLGKSSVRYFGSQEFMIGWDTRASSPMLAYALAAGISAAGGRTYLIGEVPTPCVAFAAHRNPHAVAGIMITASHNPYTDNGIKFFEADGFKQTDDREAAFETLIQSPAGYEAHNEASGVGLIDHIHDNISRQYGDFLVDSVMQTGLGKGFKIVLDCANGATSRFAPVVFQRIGAEVTVLADTPDGLNINRNCGSEHPQLLAQQVLAEKAHLGLAFDGDGDRVIAVDENGAILTGDQLMAICASEFQYHGHLTPGGVVSTVMSNLGFGQALARMCIAHHQSAVGDRQVVTLMREKNAVLGGEDSGHIVMLDQHTTGDGIYAALRLVETLWRTKEPLSRLKQVMTVFPQVLINVDVAAKPDLQGVPEVQAAIEQAEMTLGQQGRVLVRYSGTQMKCRVMVEGETADQTKMICDQLVRVVSKVLG